MDAQGQYTVAIGGAHQAARRTGDRLLLLLLLLGMAYILKHDWPAGVNRPIHTLYHRKPLVGA